MRFCHWSAICVSTPVSCHGCAQISILIGPICGSVICSDSAVQPLLSTTGLLFKTPWLSYCENTRVISGYFSGPPPILSFCSVKSQDSKCSRDGSGAHASAYHRGQGGVRETEIDASVFVDLPVVTT